MMGKPMKIARLFSGFDGAGEGIRDAGYELSWGIEYDPKIAAVAQANGHQVIVSDILDVDPATLEPVDGIHASPVCTNASVANSSAEINEDGTKEAKLDRDCAMKTVQFVEVLRPRLFTLENVWGYRNFQSFAGGPKCEGILPALKRLGYKVAYWHINAANYGVPQTRKRLILAASLDRMPERPPETHYDPGRGMPAPSLFGQARQPWVGWYEAIEDLIQALPESKFAPWQLERLPEELKNHALLAANSSAHSYGDNMRGQNEPGFAITTNADGRMRAFLMDSENQSRSTVRLDSEPVFAVINGGGTRPRAFLVHPTDRRTMPVIDRDDPSFTVMSMHGNGNMPRAFLAAGGNGTNDNCARLDGEPSWTVASVDRVGNIPRAWLSSGRVVKMTPRALARFQSFSDSFRLPESNALACKGIGNACPPLLFRRLYESLRCR